MRANLKDDSSDGVEDGLGAIEMAAKAAVAGRESKEVL